MAANKACDILFSSVDGQDKKRLLESDSTLITNKNYTKHAVVTPKVNSARNNSTNQELTKLTAAFSKSITEINDSIKLLSNHLEKVDDSVEINSDSLKLIDEALNTVNETAQAINNSMEKTFDEVFASQKNNAKTVLRGYEKLDDGWIAPFNGYQYKINPNASTWEESRGACKSLGGDLIDFGFRDVGTRITIIRALGTSGSIYYWIGLNEIGSNGYWYWVDGQRANPIDGSLWGLNYPRSITDFDCAYTIKLEGFNDEYLARNIRCSQVYLSICEKPSDVKN